MTMEQAPEQPAGALHYIEVWDIEVWDIEPRDVGTGHFLAMSGETPAQLGELLADPCLRGATAGVA